MPRVGFSNFRLDGSVEAHFIVGARWRLMVQKTVMAERVHSMSARLTCRCHAL